jgi:hypothetical protein
MGVISCASERKVVPAPLIVHVVLPLSKIRWQVIIMEGGIVIMTNGTYQWSFVTQIFLIG